MSDRLLLNNQSFVMQEGELPCLITYNEGMGGTYLTLVLAANLVVSDFKLLMMTAYPAAGELFKEQIGEGVTGAVFVKSESELRQVADFEVIIIESGNESLFVTALDYVKDLGERVILLKNFERFSGKTIEAVTRLPRLILSGNLDACSLKREVVLTKFGSVIAFERSDVLPQISVPILEEKTAYFVSESRSGVIRAQK